MKTFYTVLQRSFVLILPIALALAGLISCARAADAPADKSAGSDQVPLVIKLPSPAFKGTPKDVQLSSYVEPLSDKPRPNMMVPGGLKNIAMNKETKITCSDKNATADNLAKLADGDK